MCQDKFVLSYEHASGTVKNFLQVDYGMLLDCSLGLGKVPCPQLTFLNQPPPHLLGCALALGNVLSPSHCSVLVLLGL